MIILQLQNNNNLNNSLQVGDIIYASPALKQGGAKDFQADNNNSLGIGKNYLVGILRRINFVNQDTIELYVDEQTSLGGSYVPSDNDFIMFSKYTRGGSGLLGYYAQAKFVNNSTEKAEMFAVSSEIIINSK
tara:strand:- start:1181 stop:1576 length:396 start_codon:yes stop_codon:yes gene_type:complete